MSTNVFSQQHLLPPFKSITSEAVLPGMKSLIDRNKAKIDSLLEALSPETVSWENLQSPLEQWNDELSQAWSPVGHLNGVLNSDELRDAYNACLPLLSEYSTALGQNKKLFELVSALKARSEQLDAHQLKALDNQLLDFKLSGIALAAEEQQRVGDLRKRLSELSSKFSENVLDATQAWTLHITDLAELPGLPETALASAKALAESKELEGYVFSLDIPSYLPMVTYCENQRLREKMYHAYSTRASDQGPNANSFDNSAIMLELLSLKHELAQILGFDNYAQCSLAKKMASTPEEVESFIRDLVAKSKPQAKQELAELRSFASMELGIDDLQAWDIAYASEKLKQQRYSVSQEDLRPYFPAPKVIEGLFTVASKLFDLSFKKNSTGEVWHEDAEYYEVLNASGEVIAGFYLDIYARANKRGGAWMDECRVRRISNGVLQLPVAYLTCNFTPPTGEQAALLTHDEVTTLFHEFGHGLHHMLTKVEVAAVSGINGVAWDAVELPSQFLENWCWDKEALGLISGHYETGEPLPEALLKKMLSAKNFQSAMTMLRQLEVRLFDMRIHAEFDSKSCINIQQVLDEVRDEVAVFRPPSTNRFQHGFSHIFAGGYAAGYYSYKWAELLSADAFSKFEEEGVFNKTTGQLFKQTILEKGGSEDPMLLFKAFRGREPRVDALLRHSGIGGD